jgi:hypothetical protein
MASASEIADIRIAPSLVYFLIPGLHALRPWLIICSVQGEARKRKLPIS